MTYPKRVAVIGVSHWHSTYDAAYVELLRAMNVDVVGISDENEEIVRNRAERFKIKPFQDYKEMVDRTKPDFIVALGRHVDMPEIFRHLAEAGIPFLMEKPWGVDDTTVRELAELASRRNLWVCVPYFTRYTQWAELARSMVQSGELGAISHIVFRMIRPTMKRYVAWDSPWMLSKDQAGGGALLNLGSHGFDICRFITGEEPSVLSAVLSNVVHNSEVEDYAHVTLRTPKGIIFHNEVGYTLPTWPKNSTDSEQKLAAENAIVREVAGGVHILGPDRDEMVPAPLGYVGGCRRVLVECFERLAAGKPPPITAHDCARAVTLTHDAYRLAHYRGVRSDDA
ncbi:Gfo/Idh/MocA family protein [Bradyrhizobium cytisi]|uniref:Gfo/Idh/MocA family oxidoreductase n=1 Tax=Bradyrhizobium cytisi TaxID=515489 RepID=A0A5S4VWA3_9BRAD|nr:Gfo/Idh/MocA family oxidoreductase [Bradyrhizobium cytisi]TYL72345.1 Gfo/Idh/MocA family oxidoreductase [Bradyrhizobium cytisi]